MDEEAIPIPYNPHFPLWLPRDAAIIKAKAIEPNHERLVAAIRRFRYRMSKTAERHTLAAWDDRFLAWLREQ